MGFFSIRGSVGPMGYYLLQSDVIHHSHVVNLECDEATPNGSSVPSTSHLALGHDNFNLSRLRGVRFKRQSSGVSKVTLSQDIQDCVLSRSLSIDKGQREQESAGLAIY